VEPGRRYYLGASGSPSEVYVTEVTDDRVYYVAVRDLMRGKHESSVCQRYIAEDLIVKGLETELASLTRAAQDWPGAPYFASEAERVRRLLAGEDVPAEDVADFYGHTVRVRATKPSAEYPRGDAWYGAEEYGGVGSFDDAEGTVYEVDGVSGAALRRLREDERFVVVSCVLK
jgi:hypothetical protein